MPLPEVNMLPSCPKSSVAPDGLVKLAELYKVMLAPWVNVAVPGLFSVRPCHAEDPVKLTPPLAVTDDGDAGAGHAPDVYCVQIEPPCQVVSPLIEMFPAPERTPPFIWSVFIVLVELRTSEPPVWVRSAAKVAVPVTVRGPLVKEMLAPEFRLAMV